MDGKPNDQKRNKMLEPDHADWLIAHRAATQKSAAKLYRLLIEYGDYLQGVSTDTQDLVAVAFSLWRSAFLSDKTGYRSDTDEGAVKFLSEMLQNNAIAYSQERSSKDWTFNYYANNARYRLEELQDMNVDWDLGFPMPIMKNPKDRWEFLQAAFEKAVRCLERDLKEKKKKVTSKSATKTS